MDGERKPRLRQKAASSRAAMGSHGAEKAPGGAGRTNSPGDAPAQGAPPSRGAPPLRSTRPRRLRDISHLYLSSRSSRPPAALPVPRRVLWLGFISRDHGAAKTDVCCNFAVQLTRLGQRTLVLDLDPQLPNAGFQLGLQPRAYMAHLRAGPPQVERALLGLRVVEGVATTADLESDALRSELASSDCVLVNLPAMRAHGAAALGRLRSVLARSSETTMSQVAQRSPMFGSWLETSPRVRSAIPAPSSAAALDALVFVHDGRGAADLGAAYREVVSWMGPGRVRLLARGAAGGPMEPAPWACVQPYGNSAVGRGVLSSLYPEHPAARTYQGLVQALLAAPPSPGGGSV